MKKFFLLVFVVGVMSIGFSQKSNGSILENHPKLAALQVENEFIATPSGEPIVLRGMSLSWSQWHGKYYTPDMVKSLKTEWNCSVIRAALAVEHGGYLQEPESEYAKIEIVIKTAINLGLYVIIDWHDHHAENHKKEAAEFFKKIASSYGNYPNVIYEVYNEPIDSDWKEDIKPYHEYIIKEIRKIDPDNLIVLGTPTYSQDVDIAAQDPIQAKNIAYTLHFYSGTHQQEFRNKAEKALKLKLPIFVTEFGTTKANGDDGVYVEETLKWLEFLESHKISYCNWSVCDKDEDSAVFKPSSITKDNPQLKALTESGAFIKEYLNSFK